VQIAEERAARSLQPRIGGAPAAGTRLRAVRTILAVPARSHAGHDLWTPPRRAAFGRFLVLVSAIAATACGASSAQTALISVATPAASPQHRDAAEVELQRLLSSARVPPDARRVATPPSAQLDQPPLTVGSPDLLTSHSLWEVDMPLAATFAWIDAHPPRGLSFAGAGGGPGMDLDQWAAPNSAAYTVATLIVEIAAVGKSTEIRADAEVIWLPAKPEDEVVPAGIPVTVVVENHAWPPNGIDAPTGQTLLTRHLDAADGDQLLTDLDALLPDDGEVRHCTADTGYRVLMELVNAGAPEVFTDWYVCDLILVTRDGTSRPSLDATPQFQDEIARLVGPPPAG
jgi:hypothetical protein